MPEHGGTPVLDPDDCPDGLVVADEQGSVMLFNSAAARLTGTPPDEAVGKGLAAVLPLTDVAGRRWWDCVDPYGGLQTRTGHAERTLLLPDGTELLVTARFVRPDRGAPVTRVVVAVRDARARRRAAASQSDLVSTVAHELRSPLTSVKGFTATLLAKWERFTDEQKRLMLETVNADADRVVRLITELLDIARIDSGRLEIRRQWVDVEAAVRRHLDGRAVGGDRTRFVVDVRRPLPELWADADKLDQVLANLLENAVRHGGGTVTVRVEGVDGDATAVSVADEGEGIPEEQRARVFTRFWRGGRRGGTGLGLYIVRGIVEAHGGAIELGTAEGGGALFRFVLPSGAPELPETVSDAPDPAP